MSIVQFWRIIWARRWFILAATLSCVIGAYVVTLVLPPRWQGDSRVMLNLLKPDPITGEVMGSRTYIGSQLSLISDYSVASRVVDNLGWLADPDLIQQYQGRSSNDTRDFRHWAAQLIIDRTKVDIPDGSNILDITYTAASPESARTVADAIRRAYLDTSLSLRRADANKNADWFDAQALKAKAALDGAVSAEADFERANNVFMATDSLDVDSARLAAMAAGGAADSAVGGVSAAGSLTEIDAQIAALSQQLGPNHPELQMLRAKRAALAAAVGSERAEEGANSHGYRNAIDAAASAVLNKTNKLSRLKQLHAEVMLRRDIYNKTVARAAELRLEAAIGDTGLTPMGPATVPAAPSFPNMPLIMFGSLGLGLAMGLLVALLIELLARRVRGPEDLQSALDVPLLAVVSAPR